MFDLPKLESPLRLALVSGLALLAIAVTVVVVMRVGNSPPPRSVPPTTTPGPTAAPPSATKTAPDAWPTDPEDQIRATQRLLGALKLMDEAPTGQPGPSTQAAIRDYQHMAGLDETGEVSEALFDSLKEMAAMVFPKAARARD